MKVPPQLVLLLLFVIVLCGQLQIYRKRGFFGFLSFYVRYSTLLPVPPFRFHCVGRCGDRTKTVVTLALTASALTTLLDLIHSSARSYPQLGQILSTVVQISSTMWMRSSTYMMNVMYSNLWELYLGVKSSHLYSYMKRDYCKRRGQLFFVVVLRVSRQQEKPGSLPLIV